MTDQIKLEPVGLRGLGFAPGIKLIALTPQEQEVALRELERLRAIEAAAREVADRYALGFLETSRRSTESLDALVRALGVK